MALRWILCLLVAVCGARSAMATPHLPDSWPDPASLQDVRGQPVSFPSHSPFAPSDVGSSEDDPPTTALGTLFLPRSGPPGARNPAVVMLHGSGGVLEPRETTYGRQLAAMGVAALVVDTFGSRRDRAVEFVDRLMRITETMQLADAYAALRYLAGRPDIDPERIVLIGFSYGGMTSIYAAYAQVAERLAPKGLRFAGHVAFYGPCIARFEDHRATGAPVLMLFGEEDESMDRARCAEIAADLEAGGASVATIVYPHAHHQWDGGFTSPRRIGRNLAPCRFEVERDGTVRDEDTMIAMTGSFRRKLILALCSGSEGYRIGRDDRIRAQSNRDLGLFLESVFRPPSRRDS